jgi:hypothetical protein
MSQGLPSAVRRYSLPPRAAGYRLGIEQGLHGGGEPVSPETTKRDEGWRWQLGFVRGGQGPTWLDIPPRA